MSDHGDGICWACDGHKITRRTELIRLRKANELRALFDFIAMTPPPHFVLTNEEADCMIAAAVHRETTNMEPKTTTAPSASPALTITQRPLVEMRDRALRQEKYSKGGFEQARKNYQKAKAKRLLIEADLKKIGWKPAVAVKAKKA